MSFGIDNSPGAASIVLESRSANSKRPGMCHVYAQRKTERNTRGSMGASEAVPIIGRACPTS